MVSSFKRLKRNRVQDFEKLRALTRPNLGTQKNTRLRRAGCGSSGTLLHRNVSAQHSELLAKDYVKRLGKLKRAEAYDRLRFLTVLHSVVRLDKKEVFRAIKQMETALSRIFDGSGVWMLGAVEVEIVSLALLRRKGSLADHEARKLNVLERSQEACGSTEVKMDSGVLVHFHGVVDLGNWTLREDQLRKAFSKVAAWQRSPYQVQLKRHFSENSVAKNLRYLASYLTKGGNDQLRYNPGFGRDLDEELDAKIWRSGLGRADQGGETSPDERGLTLVEIAFLDQIWRDLMDRKRNGRGYLVKLSGSRRR